MRYEVTSPDGKRFEVTAPDGATEDQIIAYAQQQFQQKAVSAHTPVRATDSMSPMERRLAGAGQAVTDMYTGVKQRLGLASQAEVDEKRKLDADLLATDEGQQGRLGGQVLTAGATAFIPGANSIAGAALMGGAMGAAQPTAEDESALRNTLEGAALGGAGQYGIGKLAKFAGDRLTSATAQGVSQQAKNSVRDATLAASQDAGYVLPPSTAGGGVASRVLEGISGKFKTNQAAAIKNQTVTDRLARQALGLADDAPLTRDTLQTVRDAAFQRGYEPLANAGAVETDKIFQTTLNGIVKDYQGAARSFPGARVQGMHGPGKPEVMQMVDGLRTGAFDVGDALAQTRILRDEANRAYASGDTALGKATKKAANAIEDQIERALQQAGKDGQEMLKEFRAARQLIAKTYSVEKALVEGGGQVNAKVLGAALQRGKPLSGELKTIGSFANNFKDVAGVPQSGRANPITALDAFGAAGMAGMGAGPMSIALPAARIGARSLVLNPAFQKAAVRPSYGPGLLTKAGAPTLEELRRRGLGGLLGSVYAVEQ
jgi:hypothetical protein